MDARFTRWLPASPLIGDFTNGSDSQNDPSILAMDGQVGIAASAGCAAIGIIDTAPVQFEADYEVRTIPQGAVPVAIGP